MSIGDNCVLVSPPVQNEKEFFLDYGQVAQIIDVFDTFYLVLSYEDANFYYCDHDQVELFLGNI